MLFFNESFDKRMAHRCNLLLPTPHYPLLSAITEQVLHPPPYASATLVRTSLVFKFLLILFS